jgi:tRNA(Ile)-lysidine synthase
MLQKVINTIYKYNMIEKGDGVIIGLSGGPDSVSMLHILNRIKDNLDFKIYAVHLNHLIRGEEAFRDEEYAKELCKSLGVPFYLKRIKVEEYAKEHGMSSEEAGRFLRYNLFNEIAEKVGANKIALAHNMNDQAETVIMRFLRGSGISGMGGIKPVRDGRYIRPIIECSRDEIEKYCKENNLNPVIDSTNKESIYTRNRIRLELIPYIKEHFNPNIIENLYKNAEILREEEDYLSGTAEKELKRIQKRDGVDIKEFNSLHKAIKRRVLRKLINNVKGNLKEVEAKHIEDCIKLIEKGETGKNIDLVGGIRCIIEYDIFKIEMKKNINKFCYELIIPGETSVEELGMIISTRILSSHEENFGDKWFIKYYDYDKIKGRLKVRNRRDGDYMYPKGMSGKKKLKDIFIDKKIPREKRDLIPLLALDSEILWIVGLRDTNNFKVDMNTKRILEIKIKRSAGDEPFN